MESWGWTHGSIRAHGWGLLIAIRGDAMGDHSRESDYFGRKAQTYGI